MSKQSRAVPFVKSIFHPSDFSQASELAFAHALAILLIGETELVIMHARRGEREDWSQSPRFERLSRGGRCWSPGVFPLRFSFGDECIEIVLLHVNGTEFPQFNRPEGKAWVWKELRREGDVVAVILDAAAEADLIVMATEGEQGIIDALRGSVTERVVRDAPCPVLAVPARKIE
jgi:nucleotide-binding universal stress UspA family protein